MSRYFDKLAWVAVAKDKRNAIMTNGHGDDAVSEEVREATKKVFRSQFTDKEWKERSSFWKKQKNAN